MYTKNFDEWSALKKQVDSGNRIVHVRPGVIRWVTFGVNVGTEIDGKGAGFTRPALIDHVVGRTLAMVVPISSSIKPVSGYFPFEYDGKTNSLCIHQLKTVSVKRVLGRKGRLSDQRLASIKDEIKRFFSM
jgi:mRNA interferase MazF